MVHRFLAVLSIVSAVTFSASAAASLSGVVRDSSSAAGLPSAIVVLLNGATALDTAISGVTGIYKFDSVDAGDYTVQVSMPGYVAREFTLTMGDAAQNTTIKMQAMGFNAVAGTITDSITGLPVANVIVNYQANKNRKDTTGADGQYFFDSVTVGNYNFIATKTGYITKTTNVAAVAAGTQIVYIQIVKIDTLILSGTITDTSTGTAVAGAIVVLKPSSGTQKKDTTGADGKYQFANVLTGSYNVTVIDTPIHALKTVTFYAIGSAPDTLDVQIPLSELSTIQGTITDSVSALPLAGAIVALRQGISTLKTVTTGTDGTYSFDSVKTGDYIVRVTDSLYSTRNIPVTTRGTSATTVDVYLLLAPVNAVKNPGLSRLAVGPRFFLSTTGLQLRNFSDAGTMSIYSLNGKLAYRCAFSANRSSLDLPVSIRKAGGAYIVSLTQKNAMYRKQIVIH